MFDKFEYQGSAEEAAAMIALLLKQGTHEQITVLDDRGGSGAVKVRVPAFKSSGLPKSRQWKPVIA